MANTRLPVWRSRGLRIQTDQALLEQDGNSPGDHHRSVCARSSQAAEFTRQRILDTAYRRKEGDDHDGHPGPRTANAADIIGDELDTGRCENAFSFERVVKRISADLLRHVSQSTVMVRLRLRTAGTRY